jgi:hypothetical protein
MPLMWLEGSLGCQIMPGVHWSGAAEGAWSLITWDGTLFWWEHVLNKLRSEYFLDMFYWCLEAFNYRGPWINMELWSYQLSLGSLFPGSPNFFFELVITNGFKVSCHVICCTFPPSTLALVSTNCTVRALPFSKSGQLWHCHTRTVVCRYFC